ncbi:MAG: hypothetical protein QXO69_02825 [archaeon]
MGLLGRIFKKEEKRFSEKEKSSEEAKSENANRICSACNQPGADKSFGGQQWHKKCLRKMRKMAKGMI